MISRYYSILGLDVGADTESIKQAFKRLALVFHPDRGNHQGQRFAEICEAYQALMAHHQSRLTYQKPMPNYPQEPSRQNALVHSRERREGRRGSPGDRRFECILESQYKGVNLKARA